MRLRARTLFAALSIFLFPVWVSAALININTADATTLDTLPGIGPTKAAAIVAYRSAHGPFATTEDIQEVSGIGSVTYAKLAPLITVDITAATPQVQPITPQQSSSKVQKVDTADSSVSATAHVEHTMIAPPTAAGAVAGGAAALAPVPNDTARTSTFLHSTWLLGLLAVIAFAGGAFMIL